MAQRAPSPASGADDPPLDPSAVDRAYHYYRAQRQAKVEHRRADRVARLRFWAVVGALLLASIVIAVTVWSEIRQLFGL